MKKLLLLFIVIMAGAYSAQAQEKGKFRVGLDIGYAAASGGGGMLFDIEPKYNIADNMNVGLRIAGAATARDVNGKDAKVSTSSSYLGTYDYYFHNGSSSFAPFLGAGVGYYGLSSIGFDNSDAEIDVSGKFGGMVRGGFEVGKFRLGLEYNIIPKTKSEGFSITDDGSSVEVGSVEIKNSYFGVSVGFYFGGGKWKR
ncbi:outer membrane beta-barrel protein [Galbibacter pacificus]|uniref:Outer membrane beta-barrel protein n=1 Tax=Galbibacter pacificus TaxID=2996052 RepID=A0ABT6FVG2_9FLAO|nr:outer membrane beta-barrel protein [Galbibacter pacificus]MDG3583447.1 outer membrane beta-barrel protein [Galbibacter pacificus]MDG3587076.1 outer membrane beta-barrel protein [Galbibacter pacificus]